MTDENLEVGRPSALDEQLRDMAIRWAENRCEHTGAPDEALAPYCCHGCVNDADENLLPLIREAVRLALAAAPQPSDREDQIP